MTRRIAMIALAVLALGAALAPAGCGGKDGGAQVCSACGMQVAADKAPAADGKLYCDHCAPKPAEAAAETVAVHDCEGGCGMTAVPEDKMTQIDGKWYCGGCAHMLQGDHDGHNH
jgi:formylmethanofuran dehydrogenase subunit E